MLDEPEKYDDLHPLCLGTLWVRGERRVFLGSLPMDSMALVLNFLLTKKYKFIDFYGYTPRYGSAKIFTVHFEEELDEEEWGEFLN